MEGPQLTGAPSDRSAASDAPIDRRRPGPRPVLGAVAFPVAVVAGTALLSLLRVSGTSSAMLRSYVYGDGADPGLIAGVPRAVRSDEWLTNTPAMVSQAVHNFPVVNPGIAGGTDMSVILEAPYREWSTIFRPQNWGFLALPFENAFALRWWFLSALLVLGTYAFARVLLPGRRAVPVLLAVATVAMPFVQWWYLALTLGSLGWALWAMTLFVLLLRTPSARRRVVYAVLLAYVSVCFALLAYPPFQVPVALVALVFCVGWALAQRREVRVGPGLAAAAVALAAATSVVVVFAATRWETIERIRGTVYPGDRAEPTGGFSPSRLLSGFLSTRLADPSRLGQLASNPSEAAGFVLIGALAVPVAVWVVVRQRRCSGTVDWPMAAVLGVGGLFVVVMFVPGLDLVSRLTLLAVVPHYRLVIGVGLVSLVLVVLIVRGVDRAGARPPWPVTLATVALAGAAHLAAGSRLQQIAPALTGSVATWGSLSLVVVVCTGLLAAGRSTAAVAVLAVFCVGSSAVVNPLYRGVFEVADTPVGQMIERADGEDPGGWASVAGIESTGLLVGSGVLTYSATVPYPQPEDWQLLDPDGRFEHVWNRYAYVVFTDQLGGPPVQLVQPDLVVVPLDPCQPFAQRQLRHILSDRQLAGPCLVRRDQVAMPARPFYVYDVVPG